MTEPRDWRAASQPLVHRDTYCGVREFCWRPTCLEEFGDLRTVERFPQTGDVIAYCHRSKFNVLGMIERAA